MIERSGFSAPVYSSCLCTSACGRYRDFTLPPQPGGPAVSWRWEARAEPVLTRGAAGDWDSVDVLNPSVIRQGEAYYNLYSGFRRQDLAHRSGGLG